MWQNDDDSDIYMCNISKNGKTGGCGITDEKIQVTKDSAYQEDLAIYRDIIVWNDNRNGRDNWDIYLYNLSTNTETRITTNNRNQWYPVLYGNIIT